MAIRQMDGGRTRFLQFVQLAAEDGDEDAKKFLVVFSELKAQEKVKASLDLVCLAADVSRVSLLKTIVGVAFEHYSDLANLVAAAAHPAIVETTVRSAKRLKSQIGLRDRQALLTHAGFLPTPKGAVINVNANATATSAAAAGASAEPSVPRFLDDVNAASTPRDTIQRQLIAAGEAAQAAAIDAEIEDEAPV